MQDSVFGSECIHSNIRCLELSCSDVTSLAPSRFSSLLVCPSLMPKGGGCPHVTVQTPGGTPCSGRMASADPFGKGASDPPSCHVIFWSDGPLVYPFLG
jgi:hypothetical protein